MGLFHTMKKAASAQKEQRQATVQLETPEKEEQPPVEEAHPTNAVQTPSAGNEPESATPEKLPNTPLQNPTPPNNNNNTEEKKAPPSATNAMTTPSPAAMPNYYYPYPAHPAPYPYPYPPVMPPQQPSPVDPASTETTTNNMPTGATPEKPAADSTEEATTTTTPPKPADDSQQQRAGQDPPAAPVMAQPYPPGYPYPPPPPPYGYPYPAYGTPPHDPYYRNPAAGKPQPYGWVPPPPGYPNPQYWPPQPWQQVPKALPRSKAHLANKKAPNVKSIKFTKPTEKIAPLDDDRTPAAIEDMQREDIQNMGCTCKRTKCLKLYCQCFGAKLMCGPNCRCTMCANTETNEAERMEAIRTILSRNPCAFDAKYKADGSLKSKETSSSNQGGNDVTHRVGCKCRKSSCMKKYCECYAGGIKCTNNCRCVNCLNRGSGPQGGSGPQAATIMPAYYPPPPVYGPPPHVYASQQPQPVAMVAPSTEAPVAQESTTEPWEAAQSLTFLKRGTPPNSDKKPTGMGALGVSPITKMDLLPASTPDSGDHKVVQETTPQSSGDQDMLSAAIAMTEFHASPPPSASSTGGMLNSSPDPAEFASSKRSIHFDDDSNGAVRGDNHNGVDGSHKKTKINEAAI